MSGYPGEGEFSDDDTMNCHFYDYEAHMESLLEPSAPVTAGEALQYQRQIIKLEARIKELEAAQRILIEHNTAKTKLIAELEAAQGGPVWLPITKPGQVKVGDRLRFDLCGETKTHRVRQILHAGIDCEEIIYHKGNNWYVITSMAIAGKGSQKNVMFCAGKPAVPSSADVTSSKPESKERNAL